MTPKELRALCLSFNAVAEDFPFNPETSAFKVLGKLFALTNLDARPLTVNLKCDPEDAVRLREEHPGLIVPGYHMNKRHWNTVTVDGGLADRLVRELVEDSYDLVVAGLPRAEGCAWTVREAVAERLTAAPYARPMTDNSALDPEDRKIVTLARSARARNGVPEGAAVRDETGRTYAAASVDLDSLKLSALRTAVAMAVASGATSLEAAAVVTEAEGASDEDRAAVRDLGGPGTPVLVAAPDGTVRARVTAG